MILLKTIHGSRLYGLDHANSDEDWYSVVRDAKRITHKIEGDQDVMVIDYASFMRQCEKGVPQALESMFSQKTVEDSIQSIRAGFVPNYTNAFNVYSRTIRAFARCGDLKHQRHALRLAYNLEDLYHNGRFNPTLDKDQQASVLSFEQVIEPEELIERISLNGTFDIRKE